VPPPGAPDIIAPAGPGGVPAAAPQPGALQPGQFVGYAYQPERKKRTGLVLAIIGAVLVLVVGVSAVGYWVSHRSSDAFPVGSCVARQGDDAVPAACGPGKFKVVKEVTDRSRCPDPNGPAVDLQGGAKADVRCLEAVK
jgi:hypothetical protein